MSGQNGLSPFKTDYLRSNRTISIQNGLSLFRTDAGALFAISSSPAHISCKKGRAPLSVPTLCHYGCPRSPLSRTSMRASPLRSSAAPIDNDSTVSVDTRAKVEEILDRINADMNEIRALLGINVSAGTQVGWAPGSPTQVAEASKISRLCALAPRLAKREGRASNYSEDPNSSNFVFGQRVRAWPKNSRSNHDGYIIGHTKTQATILFEPIGGDVKDMVVAMKKNHNITAGWSRGRNSTRYF